VILTEERSSAVRRHSSGARKQPAQLDLFVVIDSSEASLRAVQYLADLFARRPHVHFCLMSLMPKVPAALLETGGAERPQDEAQIEANLRERQEDWMSSAAGPAEDVIGGARATLRRAGARAGAIRACQMSPLDNRTTVDEVLTVAEQQACRTIVVGHLAHSWFSGIGGGHLAEQLVRAADGRAVWVID